MKMLVHTDGGARGNPGPAAIGVVIQQDGKSNEEFGKRIGKATNNVAEYTAVVEALTHIKNSRSKDTREIYFLLDSTLVVNQLNGVFKIKDAHLRELFMKVRTLEGEVGGEVHYRAIPREQNVRADLLVNRALDGF